LTRRDLSIGGGKREREKERESAKLKGDAHCSSGMEKGEKVGWVYKQ
jgi:hypothetical protein